MKFLLWSYLVLLIFEGALRKWFLPFLSTPLLLVREPIALLALFWAWPLLLKSIYWSRVRDIIFIGLIATILTLYVGHRDWFTALYGLRIFWIQLPLIFVFPLVFTVKDVLRALWASIIISIPMVILITLQSSTPPSHILNIAVGGTGSSAFDGAGGKFRPSGIFSFTNSVTTFFTFSAASLMAVVYGTSSANSPKIKLNSNKNKYNGLKSLVIILAIISLVVALPVSISRGLLANYAVVFAATIMVLIFTRSKINSLIVGLFVVYFIATMVLRIPVVQEAADAFSLRWQLAAGAAKTDKGNVEIVESQLRGRVLGQYTEPFKHRDSYPLLGRGIGMGSNIGAVRLTGTKGFLLAESSWGKQMDELGLFIGTLFILWRIAISIHVIKISLRESFQHNNRITLILAAASVWGILNGQLGQSSALGFIVGTTGLTLASSIKDKQQL
ncbi:hypothetical protein [Synechococcus sp. A15-62]|uniref:hypothetical protein n=1 Tax=Synechococcus sp. A15-62 TaxID=1050657 RepID=UPI0016485D5A|nr:hypothetical protein [Synechococcus sp. A15-62]